MDGLLVEAARTWLENYLVCEQAAVPAFGAFLGQRRLLKGSRKDKQRRQAKL